MPDPNPWLELMTCAHKYLKGDVLLELIKPDLLRGSPMIVTVKIFDMVVPIGIYNRFMKKKIWIIKCK